MSLYILFLCRAIGFFNPGSILVKLWLVILSISNFGSLKRGGFRLSIEKMDGDVHAVTESTERKVAPLPRIELWTHGFSVQSDCFCNLRKAFTTYTHVLYNFMSLFSSSLCHPSSNIYKKL